MRPLTLPSKGLQATPYSVFASDVSCRFQACLKLWCYTRIEAARVAFIRISIPIAGLRSLQESCVSYAAYCSLPQGACPF